MSYFNGWWLFRFAAWEHKIFCFRWRPSSGWLLCLHGSDVLLKPWLHQEAQSTDRYEWNVLDLNMQRNKFNYRPKQGTPRVTLKIPKGEILLNQSLHMKFSLYIRSLYIVLLYTPGRFQYISQVLMYFFGLISMSYLNISMDDDFIDLHPEITKFSALGNHNKCHY